MCTPFSDDTKKRMDHTFCVINYNHKRLICNQKVFFSLLCLHDFSTNLIDTVCDGFEMKLNNILCYNFQIKQQSIYIVDPNGSTLP